MSNIGIDSIGFYTARHCLDLSLLASARDLPTNKFYVGLGQYKMSVPAPDEDIITMGAVAAKRALRDTDLSTISTVLFATESGVDQSKAAAVYIHRLLDLPENCRAIELKQACYGSTGGLFLALPMLLQNPHEKILLIASDVARYGLEMPGESSQGCGAIAMVLSTNPRLLTIDLQSGTYTLDIMDFWRPNYRNEALVEGKYSSRMYLHALEKTWAHYQQKTSRRFEDHRHFCYHTPVPRLTEKAHFHLAKSNHAEHLPQTLHHHIHDALIYGRLIGNSYTASLFVGLTSLLDNCEKDLSGKRIAFYSYGSGCVAEFFSGTVQPDYEKHLDLEFNQSMLLNRTPLTYQEYEKFYNSHTADGSDCETTKATDFQYRFAGIEDHKRLYEICHA